MLLMFLLKLGFSWFSSLTLIASNPVERTQDPQQPRQLPQFNNPDVIAKMRDFHNDMATLQSVKFLIYLNSFQAFFTMMKCYSYIQSHYLGIYVASCS